MSTGAARRVPLDVHLGQCAFDGTLAPLWVSGQSSYTVFPGSTYRIWAPIVARAHKCGDPG